ncbi:Cobalamin biosynthesis protein CobD/CbiB [Methanonatronarchaeum thermophilum]|uniref:Probable cobalamin biosynthesis protein CobD n=1 Tax=Methanonatronarchaeum thermophilum TaxID=1927129 RepID=A0A1Y3GGL4_9EURY|nr:cobalamin biosynthesis protein [Methanonatronarchaeum thermophilum]OUJ18516.1 Cobalamin biosynthesis protein CobD/CbiB [Methanonatronarchaeum thermophilum]
MDFFLERAIVIILALAIDMVGEPPAKIHPVIWMGSTINWLESKLNKGKKKAKGILTLLTIVFLFVGPAILIETYSGPFSYIITALIASTMFSLKNLSDMVKKTAVDDLQNKREVVQGLVSRDTNKLNEGQLNSAAVETGAENITDSVVSPLFYYALLGLPGIVLFRVVNTLDAMIGYRKPKYKEFGWFSARTDDLLNYIPSRISGILILLTGWRKGAYKVVKKNKHIKLNPGWTISAISGVLDRKLEKKGYYSINPEKQPPTNEDVTKTVKIIWKASGLFTAILITILLVGAILV